MTPGGGEGDAERVREIDEERARARGSRDRGHRVRTQSLSVCTGCARTPYARARDTRETMNIQYDYSRCRFITSTFSSRNPAYSFECIDTRSSLVSELSSLSFGARDFNAMTRFPGFARASSRTFTPTYKLGAAVHPHTSSVRPTLALDSANSISPSRVLSRKQLLLCPTAYSLASDSSRLL